MERCDFLYLLFDDFVSSDEAMDFDFDAGEVCRWLKGTAKISPRISKHYLDKKNRHKLSKNICRHFIPIMFDSSMVIQKIYELLLYDNDISDRKKQDLLKKYPCRSELAKAYAKQYKSEYTNILFLSYSGNLVQDITDLDFIDDLPEDTENERFRKHNRFLRSLKEDALLIIDNFNTTATKESFLSTMLNYHCRIIFTT